MSEAHDDAKRRFADLTGIHREIMRLSALGEIELDLEVGGAAERLDMKVSQLRTYVKKERRRRATKEAENGAARRDTAAEQRPTALPETAKEHFQVLGHDHGTSFFLPANGGQVLGIKADKLMSAGTLLQLAPLQWWQDTFPNGSGGMALHHVVDCLIQASYKTGVFDPSRIRGRGVWSDSGRAVAHLGDRLVVDGADVALTAPGDGNIYERGRKMEVSLDRPLTNKEGKAFIELCQSLNWKNRIQSGAFLAGGVAVGSVCGGLAWRPHVWITGEAGVGKSWVVETVVQPALGHLALMVQGQTSEAGIRSALRSDALAVVFEEAEPKTAQDRERIQGVLNLARQASSEGVGSIIKGTPEGGAHHYRIRSSFIYASINSGVFETADASRTVTLTLANPVSAADKKRIGVLHRKALSPGFSGRLLARMLELLPTIRQNAATFATAIARHGHDQRTGDTHGTLLAGAWALEHEKPVTPKQADKYLRDCGLLEEIDGALGGKEEARPDWRGVLDHIAQQHLLVLDNAEHPRQHRVPVAELLRIAAYGDVGHEDIGPETAEKNLTRHGLRLPPDKDVAERKIPRETLLIDRTSLQIGKWLADTAWAKTWPTTLDRTPDKLEGVSRRQFKFAGLVRRAIAIPLETVLGEDEEEG